MSARVYNAVEFKADLYDRITSHGEFIYMDCEVIPGDIQGSLWQYDENSVLPDNYATGVIRPTLQTGSGRWIRKTNFQSNKISQSYSGISNSSGIYAVTYPSAFPSKPNVQVQLSQSTNRDTVVLTSTATGFSIFVERRGDLLGLLPTYNPINGAVIDVLVTAK